MTRWLVILSLVSMALTPFSSLGAEIGTIRFDQLSDYKVPEELLLFNTKTRAGQQLDDKVLGEDIKRLYETGYFADVVSETFTAPDGTVNVIVKLTAKTRVDSVTLRGNKIFSTKRLDEFILLTPETPLDDDKLNRSAAGLRKFYEDKGYHDATVAPRITRSERQGYANVEFEIEENLRLKVGSVEFVGNTLFSSWRLRRSIANQHSYLNWMPFLGLGMFNRPELDNDRLRIRELYWDSGYLDFSVTQLDVVEDAESPNYIDLTFHLYEGEPYTVRDIRLSGIERFTDEEVRGQLRLSTGEIYDHAVARGDVERIGAMYHPLGYADFSCGIERFPDFESRSVDVEYRVRPGNVYRVRDVVISGNTITKDHVLRRELPLQPGDLLDKDLVDVGKSRLMGLGYFEEIEAVTIPTADPGARDVDIRVKEADTFKFSVGGGWSDTDGLVGVVGIQQTNFDITEPENYFQGGGQRFVAQGILGIEEMGGMIGFTEPWLFGIPLQLDLVGYARNRSYDKWDESRVGGEISLRKRFFDDFTSASLGYRMEAVRVYRMSDRMSEEMRDEQGTDRVFTAIFELDRDTRDSLTYPTSGYHVNLLSEFTTQVLGASHDYYRLEAKGIQYFSFLDKAIIAHVGGKIGTIQTIDSGGSRAPLYERYFLGGGDSIRGFPYRQVSPVNSYDEFIGGQSMIVLTAEASHPIYEFLRGAVFVDAGGSFKDSWKYNFNEINVGVGYGLRIHIPQIQHPIRLDLAIPVVNRLSNVDSKLRFHFNVGFNW